MRAILKDADITQTLNEGGEVWRNRLAEEFGLKLNKNTDLSFLESVNLLTPYGKRLADDWKKRNFPEVNNGSK